jgi:hypothetical protein
MLPKRHVLLRWIPKRVALLRDLQPGCGLVWSVMPSGKVVVVYVGPTWARVLTFMFTTHPAT